MRGLAFIGGEGPEPAFCRFLAQDAHLIAAADSGLQAAERAGLKPDWIVGDMDSLDDLGRLEKYPAERVRRFPRDKDFTDTELVLELLWEQGCGQICIAGGGGGRLDHLLAIRSLFERDKRPQRWVTAKEDVYCLDAWASTDSSVSGGEFEFKLPVASLVSIFPLGPGPWHIESLGLKWPLKGLSWTQGSFGLSNENIEEQFRVKPTQGRFMLIVPLLIQEDRCRP